MDGQIALGIGLFVLALSIPITALVLMGMSRKNQAPTREQTAVLVDQERVRGMQLVAKGQEEILASMRVHLGNIDGRLERIEKKIYE